MKALNRLALTGLVGVLLGVLAAPCRGQDYPVYWNVPEGSYIWGNTFVALATESWVEIQNYLQTNSPAFTNVIYRLDSLELSAEPTWVVDMDGSVVPNMVVSWVWTNGVLQAELVPVADAYFEIIDGAIVQRESP